MDTATDTELRGGRKCGTFSHERPEHDEAQAAPPSPGLKDPQDTCGRDAVQSVGGKARLLVCQ